MPDGNGNDGHSYGGDEEETPAEPGRARISEEARALASLGLEHSHASECLWRSARLLDASSGDDRTALLAKLVVELSSVIAATTKARSALIEKLDERGKR